MTRIFVFGSNLIGNHLGGAANVTRIGCGIAGFSDEHIAPLFGGAPPNCYFDPLWSGHGLQSWKEPM